MNDCPTRTMCAVKRRRPIEIAERLARMRLIRAIVSGGIVDWMLVDPPASPSLRPSAMP